MAYQPSVIIVDDHDLVRAGVRAQLGDAVRVIGEAGDVHEAVDAIADRTPDVVLLDVHLLGHGRRRHQGGGRPWHRHRFLALSVSDSPEDVIATIRAGARGYVTKAIKSDDLVAAVVRIAEGDAVFSPRLAGFVIGAFSTTIPDRPTPNSTFCRRREQEVMRLLAQGYAYKEIARRLSISIKTVETHASNVLRKLQLSSRHELSSWAARRRIV
ncbi:MAG: response regulator transcription factor [Acidimicrobiales bacterium]